MSIEINPVPLLDFGINFRIPLTHFFPIFFLSNLKFVWPTFISLYHVHPQPSAPNENAATRFGSSKLCSSQPRLPFRKHIRWMWNSQSLEYRSNSQGTNLISCFLSHGLALICLPPPRATFLSGKMCIPIVRHRSYVSGNVCVQMSECGWRTSPTNLHYWKKHASIWRSTFFQ